MFWGTRRWTEPRSRLPARWLLCKCLPVELLSPSARRCQQTWPLKSSLFDHAQRRMMRTPERLRLTRGCGTWTLLVLAGPGDCICIFSSPAFRGPTFPELSRRFIDQALRITRTNLIPGIKHIELLRRKRQSRDHAESGAREHPLR